MPDNTEKIAEINELLESGVKTAQIKGDMTVYDTESLRRERDRLIAEDDASQAAAGSRRKFLRVKSG